MSTDTTTTRYSIAKSDTSGWDVLADDKVVVNVTNREAARQAVRELTARAEAADDDERAVDQLTEQIARDADARADAGVAVTFPESPADDPDDYEGYAAEDEVEGGTAQAEHPDTCAECGGELVRDGEAWSHADPARNGHPDQSEPEPEPEAPKVERTGESVVARKLAVGHRIQLRGIGAVQVTFVEKVKGQQKVRVQYLTVDGPGERELWVNSRYSIVR